MSNPRKIIPVVRLNLKLPEDLRTQIDLHLWSDLEGRVPQGRYQEFFTRLAREYFERIAK